MHSPGVRFPPPLLFVAGFAAGWLLDRAQRLRIAGDGNAGDGNARDAVVPLGWLAIVAGFGLMLWALSIFWRVRTGVIPHRPATQLVLEGPFRFTRNPMYVGMTLGYVGIALLTDRLWPLVLLPLVLVALYRLVVRREERYLGHAFGDEYAAYRARVRRWL